MTTLKMSLEDAIAHCDDIAINKCDLCGDEHAQLAAWLKELLQRRKIAGESNNKILVDKQALYRVLVALSGDGVAIRELMATRAARLEVIGGKNHINQLVDDFNASIVKPFGPVEE